MTPIDYPHFIAAVSQLADALSPRPLSQAAMAIWVSALKEFPLPDLVSQLDAWAKRSTKMPAPADIWKACNEMRTERIEQTAKAEARDFRLESERTFRRSDRIGAELRALTAELRDAPPRDPKEWAQVLWHRWIADKANAGGSSMTAAQVDMACAALGLTARDANEARDEHRAARASMRTAA